MKVVNKKLNKSQILTICLLVASIVLLSGCLVMSAIAKRIANKNNNQTSSSAPLDLLPGESSYLNQPIAYPAISESQILLLQVSGPQGKYDISRYPDDQGSFMFHYYVDGKKEAIPYIPPIYGAEGDFNYESLYAVEQNDGYGRIYYLTYLCSALGLPYFRERIELPSAETEEGKAKREMLLAEYGLTQSEATTVSFVYGDRDPKTGLIIDGSDKIHSITIGKRALSGSGFYFTVDKRDYVYYTGSEYFKYALAGFHEFVKGMLVAEGIESDSSFGPYLTTDFKTWVGEVYEQDYIIKTYTKSDFDQGIENPEIIVTTDIKKSFDKGINFTPEDSDFDGYEILEDDKVVFDLEDLKKHPDFKRIEAAFKGKEVGTGNIVLTLFNEIYNSSSKIINFEGGYGSVTYEYTVSAIESVIDSLGERTSGTVSDSDEFVKITYRYSIGDQTVKHDCHAIVSLSDLSPEDKAKLVGQSIGKLDTPANISVVYTKDVEIYTVKKIEAVIIPGTNGEEDKEKTSGTVLFSDNVLRIVYNCTKNGVIGEDMVATVDLKTLSAENQRKFRNRQIGNEFSEKEAITFEHVITNVKSSHEKFIVTEITSIFDEKAEIANSITEESYVTISYYRVFGSNVGEKESMIIRLCDILDTDKLAPLKTELLGKGKGKLEEEYTVYDNVYYYEHMRDFVTYEISKIDYAVVNELIASFRFCNASALSPYSLYLFFSVFSKNVSP